jgi:peptidoglycan/xylan/chitin deacetylase (PgdA/CDA1 family)
MLTRYAALRLGFAAIARTGADRWLAPVARGLGFILMLHHVRPWVERDFTPNCILEVTPDFLDTTLSVLARTHDFVPLGDIPERLARPRPRPFVAVTFDDGYRDNVDFAMPVLKRHGVPWTVFVTPGFADHSASLWWLELEEAIRRLDRIDVASGAERLLLPATNTTEKGIAFQRLYWKLRRGPEDRLHAVVQELTEAAGVDGRQLAADLCLDWQGLAALAREPDVDIGAHTMTHPMLAKHPPDVMRWEMAECRAVLEDKLQRPVRHFAYPVGDPGSAGPREFAAAAEAGFTLAVTTRPGHLFAAHAAHPMALPRVALNGAFQNPAAVRALASGVPFLLWNRGRRLSVD